MTIARGPGRGDADEPDVARRKGLRVGRSGRDEDRDAGEQESSGGAFHRAFHHRVPSSARTVPAPATIAASFARATSRGSATQPQSGAAMSRSAGRISSAARSRAATCSGVSISVAADVDHAELDGLAGQQLRARPPAASGSANSSENWSILLSRERRQYLVVAVLPFLAAALARGVAVADVDAARHGDALESAVDGLHAPRMQLLRAGASPQARRAAPCRSPPPRARAISARSASANANASARSSP